MPSNKNKNSDPAQEKKPRYIRGKYTEAQKESTIKYLKENYDRIEIRVKKGEKERYKVIADLAGMSLNQFIITAMNNYAEKLNLIKKL